MKRKIFIGVVAILVVVSLYFTFDYVKNSYATKGGMSAKEMVFNYVNQHMKEEIKKSKTGDSIVHSEIIVGEVQEPNMLYEYDDIKENCKFSLWSADYKFKVKDEVHELEKEEYGFKDGWITRPYKDKKQYVIVEESFGEVTIYDFCYKKDDEIKDKDLCKKKLINFLKTEGVIYELTEDEKKEVDKISENVTFDDSFFKTVNDKIVLNEDKVPKVVLNKAKSQVATTILQLNKEKTEDLIVKGRISDINELGLGHAGLNETENLYRVHYVVTSKEGVEMNFVSYVVQIVNREENYAPYSFNEKELNEMLDSIKDGDNEEDKYHTLLSNLVNEYRY